MLHISAYQLLKPRDSLFHVKCHISCHDAENFQFLLVISLFHFTLY